MIRTGGLQARLLLCALLLGCAPAESDRDVEVGADQGVTVLDVAASDSDSGFAFPVCKPGDLICLDERTRARCADDGLSYKPISFCSAGFACGAGALCRPLLCTPGSGTCLSLEKRVICDTTGTGFLAEELLCDQAAVCLDGQCVPRICTLDDVRCLGSTAVRCIRLGTQWAPANECSVGVPGCGACAGTHSVFGCVGVPPGQLGLVSAIACPAGQPCAAGVCRPTVCEPNTLSCIRPPGIAGVGLAACTGNGTGWKSVKLVCKNSDPTATTCFQCLPNGDVVDCRTVNLKEDVAPFASPCGPLEVCIDQKGCVPLVCTPGELRCDESGALERCDGAGVEWVLDSPSCGGFPCVHCASAGKRATCTGPSKLGAQQSCPAGQGCVSSVGCAAYNCTSSATHCNEGGSFVKCGPDGFGEVPLSCGAYGDCADGASGFGCGCGDAPGCRALSGCVPEVGTGIGSGGSAALRVTFQDGVAAGSGERFVHIAPVVDPATGLAIDGLAPGAEGQPGVSLTEDGVARPLTCEHLLLSPDATLDLAFVLDMTSSMTPALDALRANLLALAVALGKSGLDARFGAVAFADSVPLSTMTPLALTEDLQTFGELIAAWNVVSGGDAPESGLDALLYANSAMNWRPGAQRALVLITDAPLHDAFDGSGASTASLVALLDELAGQASVHVIGPGEGRPAFEQARWPTAELVGCASGGSRQSLAEFLANPVADSPLVRGLSQSLFCTYESADPSAAHTLTVTVRAEVAGEVLKGSRTR